MSPLDLLVQLRSMLGEHQPITLVADLVEFDKFGSIDVKQPSFVRPECLPLRTDFTAYAEETNSRLKQSQASVRSHLCASQDPYVFLCRDVTVFRGPREGGYPFLEHPASAHVIATAEVEARPGIETFTGSSGRTEWYADEKAHTALLERLNLISLVALNQVTNKGKEEDSVDSRPILILGSLGCGGGRSGRHPHHAVANALKHWRRRFGSRFRSIFVCCESDGGYGDTVRANLLDRIINRQVYKTITHVTEEDLAPWHWDMRQIQLCIRPSKLEQVIQLQQLRFRLDPDAAVEAGWDPAVATSVFQLDAAAPDQIDQGVCEDSSAVGTTGVSLNTAQVPRLSHVGEEDTVPESPKEVDAPRSRNGSYSAPMFEIAKGQQLCSQKLRKLSVLLDGPCLPQSEDPSGSQLLAESANHSEQAKSAWKRLSVLHNARKNFSAMNGGLGAIGGDSDSEHSLASSSDESVGADWIARASVGCNPSRRSSAVSNSCLSRRTSVADGQRSSVCSQSDADSTAVHATLKMFGWQSSNSRRNSQMSRRTSAISSSSRRGSTNPESELDQSGQLVPPCASGHGHSASKDLSLPVDASPDCSSSQLDGHRESADGSCRVVVPASLLVPETQSSSDSRLVTPRISFTIPEDCDLPGASKKSHPKRLASKDSVQSSKDSVQSSRKASISMPGSRRQSLSLGSDSGRRMSVGQRITAQIRRASTCNVGGDRRHSAAGALVEHRRESVGISHGELVAKNLSRRFSTSSQSSCMQFGEALTGQLKQVAEDQSDSSSGLSRCSSRSSCRSEDVEKDLPELSVVQTHRLAGELADDMEDIEVLKQGEFQSLLKPLFNEQSANMRRRSTLADILGTGDLGTLNVDNRSKLEAMTHAADTCTKSAAARPKKGHGNKVGNKVWQKKNKKESEHTEKELALRRQVREKLRKRRENMECNGPGSGPSSFNKHFIPVGCRDGGDDSLDDRPHGLSAAEQLKTGRRTSNFFGGSGGRNLVL